MKIMSCNFLLDSELYTYEYFLQEDVCRLCWNRNAEEIVFCSENTSSLVQKIKDCLGIIVIDISKPNKLCSNCCEEIEKFHEFKKICCENDLKLRDILQKGEKEIINTIDASQVKIEVDLPNAEYSKIECVDFFDDLNFDDTGSQESGNNLKSTKQTRVKLKKKYSHKRSPTYCNICSIDLEKKDRFHRHNSECHGVEDDGASFKCFGCDKRFKSRKNRIGHELNFCRGLKDGYKCNICNRYLPNRGTYESHMKDHRQNTLVELPEDLFKCKKCSKLFSTKECLRKHVKEQCGERKDFVCDTCGRVFSRQDYLHKHLLMHSGTKEHCCPHCDFRATQKSTLTVHIRRHTGERPYSCDLCPLKCTSSSNLRAHRRRHLGVKLFECTICNKKFGYKISLEEHVSATHERSEAHTCEDCGSTYSQFRGLRRHLATKHGKKTAKKSESSYPPTDGAKADILKDVERNFEIKDGDDLLIKSIKTHDFTVLV